MNLAFTGPQSSEYFKKFYPIDHIACDKISRNSAKPPHEVLAIVNRNGKNWLDRFHFKSNLKSINPDRIYQRHARSIPESPP